MLSQAEIDRFHRDGFLVMRQVVTGAELALLQAASQVVIDQGIARQGDSHLYQRRPDGSEVYWRSEGMWQRDPAFRAVALNPRLLENVGQCIGAPFFPWNDSLVVKTPGGEGVGWHQDPPYGDPARLGPAPTPNFTTDLYLDDSDQDNGCVWAIPGHHLVGHVRLEDFTAEELFNHPEAVPVRLRAGDALFHALSTPHGSRPNRSQRWRRTFYIHYLSSPVLADAAYQWRKEGWDAAKREQLERMAQDRRELCLEPAWSPARRHGAQGIEVDAPTMTPPGHWRALAAAIAEPERERLRTLALRAAGAVA
jgi:ectoine hydroxylase-related dioxygenase (phytanoyl-CoA dioxygenase family)